MQVKLLDDLAGCADGWLSLGPEAPTRIVGEQGAQVRRSSSAPAGFTLLAVPRQRLK
jgi:hypothetical protein